METALANFVASAFVLFRMQLRIFRPFCALLQRMGIFAFYGAVEQFLGFVKIVSRLRPFRLSIGLKQSARVFPSCRSGFVYCRSLADIAIHWSFIGLRRAAK